MDELQQVQSIVNVDRVLHDLRHGLMALVTDGSGNGLLVCAAENADASTIARLATLTHKAQEAQAELLLTAARAAKLGVATTTATAIPIVPSQAEQLPALIDPVAKAKHGADEMIAQAIQATALQSHALKLAKYGSLLPALLAVDVTEKNAHTLRVWAQSNNMLMVGKDAILAYKEALAVTLRPVSEAQVPLQGAENTKIIAFRPRNSSMEHLAIVIGSPKAMEILRNQQPGRLITENFHRLRYRDGNLRSSLH